MAAKRRKRRINIKGAGRGAAEGEKDAINREIICPVQAKTGIY